MGYLDFVDEAIGLLERGGQAFNMMMLFMGESQKIALQMTEVEVGKRLSNYTYKKPLKDPKGDNQKGDTVHPKGSREPQKGTKRTVEGKPVNLGKQSSSDKTTQVEPPVVCDICGGKHSAETVKMHGKNYVCPFVHYSHPHVNLEAKAFLDSTMGCDATWYRVRNVNYSGS